MVRIRAIPLLLAAFVFLGCERMETVETAYPDFEAAVKAEAIGDGKWIPGFLPPSATSIREVHNLDTNEVWLFFRFSSGDLPALVSSCKQLAEPDIVLPRKRPGNWWPQVLARHREEPRRPDGLYEHYQCRKDSVLAIDRNKNEAYFWAWVTP